MNNKWFIVLLFSVFFIGAFLGGFFEEENPIQKILIDEYFDENIKETIYVYCFENVIWYNITNHDLESFVVCYFNVSSGYIEEDYVYNRDDMRCVREKSETNIWEELHFEKRN